MKKFFALLFVCAGLTAMAVTPRINTNVNVAQGKAQKSMVLKSNTLGNQLSAPAMKVTAETMTPHKVFAEKGGPAQNMLMKKAPRRLGAADVLGDKIAFMLGYTYDEDEGVVLDNDYLWGGWTAELTQGAEDNQFYAYIYFSAIPFTINVDFTAATAEMVMETLAGFNWVDTVQDGNTITYNDTTEYIALWDEAFMLTDDATAEPTNLQGEVLADGSLYFEDGWTLYDVQYIKKTTIRNGRTNVTYDTVAGLLCPFMRSTYLLTPNANHEYTGSSTGATRNVNAFMYQYDDTTVVAWNLWGMGNRGMEFYLHEDGEMFFPSYQVAYTEDISDYAEQYSQYNWDYAYEFYTFGMDVDEDGNPIENTENEDGQAGTWDANGLYWPVTEIMDLIGYGSSWYFGVGFYPFINNKLTFIQTEPEYTRGDVDMDGSIGIADVTCLIDYLLTGDATGISLEAANTDLDDSIGIADVTTLIDYILNGHW